MLFKKYQQMEQMKNKPCIKSKNRVEILDTQVPVLKRKSNPHIFQSIGILVGLKSSG